MRISAEATKLVGAQAEKVYAILARPEHHKRILPKAFVSFELDQEGVWQVQVKAGFLTRTLRIIPEETEANKLFTERELNTNATTLFSLQPHPDGTLVTISTTYERKGFAGFLESLFAPGFMRGLYEEELTKLCRYALIASLEN